MVGAQPPYLEVKCPHLYSMDVDGNTEIVPTIDDSDEESSDHSSSSTESSEEVPEVQAREGDSISKKFKPNPSSAPNADDDPGGSAPGQSMGPGGSAPDHENEVDWGGQ